MSKLYFYYGTVCSSKTLNLLAVYKNYEIQGRKAVLIRPSCDTRSENVESRTGMSAKPDISLPKDSSVYSELIKFFNKYFISLKDPQEIINSIDAIIVDECQFLSIEQIKELRQLSIGVSIFTEKDKDNNLRFTKITTKYLKNTYKRNEYIVSVPVICYGLRTDSTGNLWSASAVLMAQADELHEIKTVCSFCNKRAVFSSINPKKQNTSKNEKENVNPSWGYYIPVCPEHYFSINQNTGSSVCSSEQKTNEE